MRILSWNVDGVAKWLGSGELARHLGTLGDFDVICLQEIRLRPADREQLRDLLPGYTVASSLADDPRNVTFRGGRAYGVATFVRGDATSTVPGWDREGRVLVTTLPGLAIVNLYAVNGTAKPYVDPATGAALGDRHAFKQRFQANVLALGDELARTADAILVGDWNVSQTVLDVTPRLRSEEPHATARAQLLAGFAAGDWVDPFRARSPDARRYTWFGKTRGGKLDAARVDYFVVRRELLPRIRAADILDDRARSDHAPIVLDLAPRVHSAPA
jgi:exodeoxyribonuclease III